MHIPNPEVGAARSGTATGVAVAALVCMALSPALGSAQSVAARASAAKVAQSYLTAVDRLDSAAIRAISLDSTPLSFGMRLRATLPHLFHDGIVGSRDIYHAAWVASDTGPVLVVEFRVRYSAAPAFCRTDAGDHIVFEFRKVHSAFWIRDVWTMPC